MSIIFPVRTTGNYTLLTFFFSICIRTIIERKHMHVMIIILLYVNVEKRNERIYAFMYVHDYVCVFAYRYMYILTITGMYDFFLANSRSRRPGGFVGVVFCERVIYRTLRSIL